jgi:hypothetical protein
MMSLQERITELMQTCQWDVVQVSKIAEISKSAVYQWIGKGSKPIKGIGKIAVANRLQAASIEACNRLRSGNGYASLWIATGVGPKFVKPAPEPIDLESHPDLLPITGCLDALIGAIAAQPQQAREGLAKDLAILAVAPDSAQAKARVLAALAQPKALLKLAVETSDFVPLLHSKTSINRA